MGAASTAHKILNMLIHEEILTKFPGDEGPVYVPERSHAHRMRKMLDELNVSLDPIWQQVSEI
jgi:hypothetical protein